MNDRICHNIENEPILDIKYIHAFNFQIWI